MEHRAVMNCPITIKENHSARSLGEPNQVVLYEDKMMFTEVGCDR